MTNEEILAPATATVEQFVERFTAELDGFVRERLPMTMSNADYANGTSGMLIALNRVVATCTVAFAETHGMAEVLARGLVARQLTNNLDQAYDAFHAGQGGTVQ